MRLNRIQSPKDGCTCCLSQQTQTKLQAPCPIVCSLPLVSKKHPG